MAYLTTEPLLPMTAEVAQTDIVRDAKMSSNSEQVDALIPGLSSTIDDVFELDRIVFSATGDRLFKQYTSANATLDKTLIQLLTNLPAHGSETQVLGIICRDRVDRDDLRAAIVAACPYAANEPQPLVAPLSAQRGGKVGDAPPTTEYAPGLERHGHPYLDKLGLRVWLRRLASIENRVCRIEIDDNASGTGFSLGRRSC
ncbi:hypothetical protein ACC808_22065 [Rhizobium ruizarguesonis]